MESARQVTTRSEESIQVLIKKLESIGNFTMKKVRAKFIILEFLAYLSLIDCLDKMWQISFTARGYLIKNFRYLNNVLLSFTKDKFFDMSKQERLVNAFNHMLKPSLASKTRIRLRFISIQQFNYFSHLMKSYSKTGRFPHTIHEVEIDNYPFISQSNIPEITPIEEINLLYENLRGANVRNLEIKQYLQYPEFDFTQLTTVKELTISNKDQLVSHHAECIAEKLALATQKNPLITLGVRTYGLEEGLAIFFSKLQDRTQILGYQTLLWHNPYINSSHLEKFARLGVRPKRLVVDKVRIELERDSGAKIEEQISQLNETFSYIKLALDHSGHSYVFPFNGLEQLPCVMLLGQSLYRLKIEVGKLPKLGSERTTYNKWQQQCFQIDQSKMKLQELEITKVSGYKGDLNMSIYASLLLPFPNIKKLTIDLSNVTKSMHLNVRIAKFNSLRKLVMLNLSQFNNFIVEWIFFNSTIALEELEITIDEKQNDKKWFYDSFSQTILQRIDQNRLTKLKIVDKSTFIQFDYAEYSYQIKWYQYLSQNFLALRNVHFDLRMKNCRSEMHITNYICLLQELNQVQTIRIAHDNNFEGSQKIKDQFSELLRDKMPKLKKLIIDCINVPKTQNGPQYYAPVKHSIDMQRMIHLILGMRTKPLKLIVNSSINAKEYLEIQAKYKHTKHQIYFEDVQITKEFTNQYSEDYHPIIHDFAQQFIQF